LHFETVQKMRNTQRSFATCLTQLTSPVEYVGKRACCHHLSVAPAPVLSVLRPEHPEVVDGLKVLEHRHVLRRVQADHVLWQQGEGNVGLVVTEPSHAAVGVVAVYKLRRGVCGGLRVCGGLSLKDLGRQGEEFVARLVAPTIEITMVMGRSEWRLGPGLLDKRPGFESRSDLRLVRESLFSVTLRLGGCT
jgi:hypothetical protein